MKLAIRNILPLRKGGTIDLQKRFLVYTGYPHSGKTYLAQLLAVLLDEHTQFGENQDNTRILYENPIEHSFIKLVDIDADAPKLSTFFVPMPQTIQYPEKESVILNPYHHNQRMLAQALENLDKGNYSENDAYKDLWQAMERANLDGQLLYLYLKYWAKPSQNLLIIDQPEHNLHPHSQVILMDILMQFASRCNNRIILITNSLYITNAINNYIRIGYLVEQEAAIAPILEDLKLPVFEPLSWKQFGAYFFDGEAIKETKINEYGAFFRSFADEEDRLRELGDKLKNYIYNI